MGQKHKKINMFNQAHKQQDGSALIYVLFVLVFVVIVATVMLATVTYGQRNIVKNEQNQNQFYRAEGAIEVILTLMDEYENPIESDETEELQEDEAPAEPEVEEGAYYYIKNVLNPSKNYEYTIGGQKTKIVGEVLFIDDTKARAKLYDPLNPNTYREISTQNPNGGDGGGGSPPPPPSIEDPGFAYYDLNLNFRFDPTEDIRVPKVTLENKGIDSEYRLIVPANVGDIYKRNSQPYKAAQGIYLSVGIKTAPGNHFIHLESSQGNIVINNGVNLTSSKGITISAEKGSINVKDITMTSRSGNNGEIKINAEEDIFMENTTLDSARNISITSNSTIYADGADLTTGKGIHGTIELRSKGDISINQANLEAFNYIIAEGGSTQYTIFVSETAFTISKDRNHVATAEPRGININGKPVSGCISNGVETVCP
jgi:hypothetical protein